LAGNVIRVSPPMVMTEEQARASLGLLAEILQGLAVRLRS
jgi:4-aminobutyrate aminotransferase-like enzyme